jgi:VWFA-related protein
MKNASLALLLIWLLVLPIAAQNPAPKPVPPPQDDDVVRITTNLVQVDVTVKDKKGQYVTDLKPEDFEIYEDGKLQPITNFSYISLETPRPPEAAPTVADKNAPPAPPVKLKPEQVRRTFALVVDDLGLSFESVYYVRRALKKFVDEQMQPGDLVAIIRTAGGMGALQSFTSDKRQLYAAIERVKWYPLGRGGISAFAPIESDPLQAAASEAGDEEALTRARDLQAEQDEFRSEVFAVGTLGALGYIVNGLRELPGRKSVLLLSDGFRLQGSDGEQTDRIIQALRRLTDLANRASVVIYTMDPRGLQTLGLSAADNVSGLSQPALQQQLDARRDELLETQFGLAALAEQTGGFDIKNTNDLTGGIKQVLADQSGYYLIGYRPDDTTFDKVTGRRTYHKITVKLKRPGLTARTRKGFFGVTDERAAPVYPTAGQRMVAALTSPFGAGGVRVRLTSMFANDPKTGSFVRSLLYIDGHDLTFAPQPDGTHKTTFDVLAFAFGDNGQVINSVSKTYTLTITKNLERLIQTGLVYYVNVPLKKPGAYQMRVALRDAASERIGSASQFIEAPDLKKGRLTLSGVAVNGDSDANPSAAEGAQTSDPGATPAVRRLRPGMFLNYGYWIYNAKFDKKTNSRQVTTQAKIYQDGKEIFAGPVRPYQMPDGAPNDPQRLVAGGRLRLGSGFAPGEYVLQIIATDPLAKAKYRIATQWIDFEVVK